MFQWPTFNWKNPSNRVTCNNQPFNKEHNITINQKTQHSNSKPNNPSLLNSTSNEATRAQGKETQIYNLPVLTLS